MSQDDRAGWPKVARCTVPVGETLTVPCWGCGNPATLFWNGGELDRRICCGYLYATEHSAVELAVRQRPIGPECS